MNQSYPANLLSEAKSNSAKPLIIPELFQTCLPSGLIILHNLPRLKLSSQYLGYTDDLLVLDLHYLVNILTNINNISKVYLCYLANTLANINSISKIDPCHLANTLANINDKTDNFIKKEVWLCQTNNSLLITR